MASQIASGILMVRPAAFGFNTETAANNVFQSMPQASQAVIQSSALEEFDRLVALLLKEGVDVIVIEDSASPVKPDAIFPNNWISFHESGTIVTYPMFSTLRRTERREDIIENLASLYKIEHLVDLAEHEIRNEFLEGTGSMVLDRENKIAYACLSPRTDPNVLQAWCDKMGYVPFTFRAQIHGQDIYHTNVMMAIGDGIAAVCLDVVEHQQRERLFRHLVSFGREVVVLRQDQVDSFAGNMLAIRNKSGEQLMVMSAAAFQSLDEEQLQMIGRHARVIYSDVHTIESVGGGSVRCMIAEIFLLRI